MSDQVYQCFCGIKTRAPFIVNGEKLCAVCAERVAPRLVQHRAAQSWREFTATAHRIPTTPGFRARTRPDV